MDPLCFFPYSWEEKIINGKNEIQGWGKTEQGETGLLRVQEYPVTCKLQLPDTVGRNKCAWNQLSVTKWMTNYKTLVKDPKIQDWKFHWAKEFYYYQTEKKPFVTLAFASGKDMYNFISPIRTQNGFSKSVLVPTFGYLHLRVHELEIKPIKKFLISIKAKQTGWFRAEKYKCPPENELAKAQYKEFHVDYRCLTFDDTKKEIPPIRVMSFDIETYSHRPGVFPDENQPEDCAYMISCVSEQSDAPEKRKRTLITYGECPVDREDVQVLTTYSEEDMILQFIDYIQEDDPDLITGYNTLKFDWPYLYTRLRRFRIPWDNPWARCSRLKVSEDRESAPCNCKANSIVHECTTCSAAPYIVKEMTSSGRGENIFRGVRIKGRMSMVDMYVIVLADYKTTLSMFSLNYVSDYFLRETKRDVKTNEMFAIFKEWAQSYRAVAGEPSLKNQERLQKAQKEYGRVGDYCIQDSELTNKLMVKLNTWNWMCSQAMAYGVDPEFVYLYGQAKRGLALFYELCVEKNIVMNNRIGKPLKYKGGYVSEPRRGIHMTFCVDYNSLYPNTGRRYNICFTTLCDKIKTMKFALQIALIRNLDFPYPVCTRCNEAVLNNESIFCKDHEAKLIKVLLESIEKYGDIEHKDYNIAIWSEEFEEKKEEEKNEEEEDGEGEDGDNGDKDKLDLDELLGDEGEEGKEEGKVKKKRSRKKEVVKTTNYHMFMFRKVVVKEDGTKENEGIFPILAERLIEKRKAVKREMKNYPADSIQCIRLDQEQLTLKIATNSLYGFLGRGVGEFLFPEGAMSITYWGRHNIIKTGEHLEAYYKDEGAEVIYGDTDSVMVELHNMKGATGDPLHDRKLFISRCKEFEAVANQINEDPMHVEFEKAMYAVFFQKKMYAYYKIKDDGNFEMEEYSAEENGKTVFKPKIRDKGYFKGHHLPVLHKKGIPLARREDDFFKLDMYEACLRKMLDKFTREEIKQVMVDIGLKLMHRQVPIEDLCMVSGVSSEYKDKTYKLKVFSDHRAKIGRPVVGGERYKLLVCVPKGTTEPSYKLKVGEKLRGIDEYQDHFGTEEHEEVDYLYYIEKTKRAEETYTLIHRDWIEERTREQKAKDDRAFKSNFALSCVAILGSTNQEIYQMRDLIYEDPDKIIDFAYTIKRCKTKVENIRKMLRKKEKMRNNWRLLETSKPIIQIYRGFIEHENLMKEIREFSRETEWKETLLDIRFDDGNENEISTFKLLRRAKERDWYKENGEWRRVRNIYKFKDAKRWPLGYMTKYKGKGMDYYKGRFLRRG